MKKIVVLFISVFVVIACQKNPSRQDTTQVDGTTHTGGSNTINGRPIESYIVDVEKLPAFQNYVEPILKDLEQKLPHFAQSLRDAVHAKRTWYMIPGSLKVIPNANIAIPSSIETEQFALHMEKSIWMSQNIYEQTVSDELRAMHILHEMVMANRVDANLQLHPITDQQFLSTKDYEEIRSLTHLLMYDLKNTTAENLHQILKENDFYRGEQLFETVYMPPHQAWPFGWTINLDSISSAEDIIGAIQSQRYAFAGSSRYGYYDPTQDPPPKLCYYELNEADVAVQVYDLGGKVNTRNMNFTEMVDFKRSDKGAISIEYIDKDSFQDGEVLLVHFLYFKETLAYFEIYPARKWKQDRTGFYTNLADALADKNATWEHVSVQNGQEDFIPCVNRNVYDLR
jgi:hypothetical protein